MEPLLMMASPYLVAAIRGSQIKITPRTVIKARRNAVLNVFITNPPFPNFKNRHFSAIEHYPPYQVSLVEELPGTTFKNYSPNNSKSEKLAGY
jgi:hypothetical protein